jgi:anti-sigma B factor antagonist
MQDTVDPAAVPPRTLAQISGDAPRGAERGVAVAVAAKVSAGDPVTRLLEGRGEEARGGLQVAHAGHEHDQGGPGPVRPPGVARSRPPGVRSSARGLGLAGHPLMKAGRGAITMTAVSDPLSATVVLDGEIDIATAPAIRRLLLAAISGGDVHLTVDVSGVTFIGAAGIGVLVAAANRAREAGGSLSLLAPSQQVRWLLDVLHLDAILPAAQSSGGPFVAGSAA